MFYVRFADSLSLFTSIKCDCNESFPHINYVGDHFNVALQLGTMKYEWVVEMIERQRERWQKTVLIEPFSGNESEINV